MRSKLRSTIVALGAVVALGGLSACGEGGSGSGTGGDGGTGTGGTGAAVPTPAVNAELAAKVPAEIKSAGAIKIGTDASYAPSEFLDADGKTVVGFDVDLFNAVAAKLGLKTTWQPSKFDAIIPGVLSKKYQVGVSSFTINDERLRQATMVSYFRAGTAWAQKKGGTIDPDNACGKRIAVQTGTVQVPDITARSKKCTGAGKPAITIDQYQAQSDATAAVVSGKDEAMLADSPVAAYAVKQTNGQLALAGAEYDSALYGYVLPKDQQAFAEVFKAALRDLMTDGTYQKVVDKWGLGTGAIKDPAVNPTS